MTDIDTPAPDQDIPEAPRAKRPSWFVPAIVGAGVIVAAAAVVSTLAIVNALGPHNFVAKGAVVISDTTCDSIPGGYSDIAKGAGVAVKDPSGKTVALGELADGKDIGAGGCAFLFDVKDVPSGLGIYGVEVTHRGTIQYKEAVLKKDGAVMSLGD